MKRQVVALFAFALLTGVVALSQTTGELRSKYGPPDDSGRYVVRPGIGLEMTYGPDGRPAAMIVKLLDDGTTTDSNRPQRRKAMRRHIALEILDEIMPASRRGKQTRSFLEERGCFSLETIEYDNVTTKVANRCEQQGGGTYSIEVHWKE